MMSPWLIGTDVLDQWDLTYVSIHSSPTEFHGSTLVEIGFQGLAFNRLSFIVFLGLSLSWFPSSFFSARPICVKGILVIS